MKLIGFEPSINLELQFTGLELLHLLYGAKLHYDGHCKATIGHAGKDGYDRNGLLVTTMMRMGEYPWNDNGMSDMAFLSENLDATADRSFTGHEVDTLCKITECFNMIAGMKVPPLHFSVDVATSIFMGLRRALNEATTHIDTLHEQEKLRRAILDKPGHTAAVAKSWTKNCLGE